MKQKTQPEQHTKKQMIDFKTLSKKGLNELMDTWTNIAIRAEIRLEKLLSNPKTSEEAIQLFKNCNKLWKRVSILNKFITKTSKD